MRSSPVVNDAVEALDGGDAGAAVSLLEEYLSTGKCDNGTIGAPSSVNAHPNAAFDLGLGLFEIAERFGKRFGEDPPPPDGGRPPAEEAELAKRSAEVDCALRIVRLAATDSSVPVELRARAFYLSGNLEFLRREYKNAVAGYDAALKLIPGLPGDAGDGIGRDAAYTRSIALRRIEDQEKDAGPPDAGNDGGEKPDAGDQKPDGGDQKPDAGEQKPDAGEQKPDAGKNDQDDKDGGANRNRPTPASRTATTAASHPSNSSSRNRRRSSSKTRTTICSTSSSRRRPCSSTMRWSGPPTRVAVLRGRTTSERPAAPRARGARGRLRAGSARRRAVDGRNADGSAPDRSGRHHAISVHGALLRRSGP